MNNKNLGRGLSAFLDLENTLEPKLSSNPSVIKIDVNNIVPNPYQPRQNFNDENLVSLAESIKSKGVIQPILVIKQEDGKYQLVAGERRLRASKLAELSNIPAIVVDADCKEQLEIAILENIQREDLNPIDEAEGYKRLIDEFHYTQEEISKILGKSRSHIANTIRLLSLSDEVKTLVRNKKISFGHARTLIGLENAEEIAKSIINESMNVRQAEDFVRRKKNNPISDNFKNNIDPDILNVANQIASLIELNVNIKLKNKGGIIEIEFKDFEELDHFIGKMNNLIQTSIPNI